MNKQKLELTEKQFNALAEILTDLDTYQFNGSRESHIIETFLGDTGLKGLKCMSDHIADSFDIVIVEPPRWRAKWDEVYYYVNAFGKICMSRERHCEEDTNLYNAHNYFKTEEEAEKVAQEISAVLKGHIKTDLGE